MSHILKTPFTHRQTGIFLTFFPFFDIPPILPV